MRPIPVRCGTISQDPARTARWRSPLDRSRTNREECDGRQRCIIGRGAPAARRTWSRQGQVRPGHQGGSLGFRDRPDGAGLCDRHRGRCAGGAHAARRPAQAREGSRAHLREPRRGAARGRHRSRPSGSHRPVLHDGQSGAALSTGASRSPGRTNSAIDLDRAAAVAAARRGHEHPGDGRSFPARASRCSISSTSSFRAGRRRAIRRR